MKDSNFTVWNLVKPFYWILKFFGLGVFTIDGDIEDGKIKTSIWDIFQMILVLSVQFYILHINIKFDMSLSRTSSILIDRGAHFIEIFNSLNVLLSICLYALFRKRIWRIFRKCYEFDVEVS